MNINSSLTAIYDSSCYSIDQVEPHKLISAFKDIVAAKESSNRSTLINKILDEFVDRFKKKSLSTKSTIAIGKTLTQAFPHLQQFPVDEIEKIMPLVNIGKSYSNNFPHKRLDKKVLQINDLISTICEAYKHGRIDLLKSNCQLFAKLVPQANLYLCKGGELKLHFHGALPMDKKIWNQLDRLVKVITSFQIEDVHFEEKKICRWIQDCYNLTTLHIVLTGKSEGGERVIDKEIQCCPHITTIKLIEKSPSCLNHIIAFAKKCPKITQLDMTNCHFLFLEDVVDLIGVCSSLLQILKLRGVSMLNDEGIEHIQNEKSSFPHLKKLDLSYLNITGESLPKWLNKCQSLENLNLFNCSYIQDKNLAEAIKATPCLQTLFVNKCKSVGDRTVKAIAKYCPLISDLNFNYTAVTDSGAVLFKECKNLRTLYLKCRKISQAKIEEIWNKKCLNLTILDTHFGQKQLNS